MPKYSYEVEGQIRLEIDVTVPIEALLRCPVCRNVVAFMFPPQPPITEIHWLIGERALHTLDQSQFKDGFPRTIQHCLVCGNSFAMDDGLKDTDLTEIVEDSEEV